MLHDDLEAARSHWIKQGKPGADRQRREGSSFLVYRTDAGVADFHALRHAFITNLARAGVHPKIAQDLARHSDINLTMSRYSHTVLAEQAEALAALPDLRGQTQSDSETAAQSATADSVLGRRLGSNERFPETSVDSGGLNLGQLDRAQLLAVLEDVLDLAGLTQQPPNGLEPLTCGLQNRCSTN